MSLICLNCKKVKKSNRGVWCRICVNKKTNSDPIRNKKISIAKKGEKHSLETKEKIRAKALIRFKDKRNHPNYNKKLSEQTKQKIREANLGENNHCWKGGRIKNNCGYIWIYYPNHPNGGCSSLKNYILEHRLVMEKKIGRYLKKGEIVHHINGIRDDNRPENLFLTTSSKHVAYHNKLRNK